MATAAEEKKAAQENFLNELKRVPSIYKDAAIRIWKGNPDRDTIIDLSENQELVEAAQSVRRLERSKELSVLLKKVGLNAGDVDRFLYVEPVLIESAVTLLKQLEKGDLSPYNVDELKGFVDVNKVPGRNPEYEFEGDESSYSDSEIKNNIENRIDSNPFVGNQIINNTLFVDWLVGTKIDQELGTSGLEDVEAIANNTKQSAAEKEDFVDSMTRKFLEENAAMFVGGSVEGEGEDRTLKIIDPFGETLGFDEKYGGGGFKGKSAGVVKRILDGGFQGPKEPEYSKNIANPAAAAARGVTRDLEKEVVASDVSDPPVFEELTSEQINPNTVDPLIEEQIKEDSIEAGLLEEDDSIEAGSLKEDPGEQEILGTNRPALDPAINTQVIADLVAEFGSYAYFQNPDKPEFVITENERGETIQPINIIDYIESRNITSTVIMRQLFKKTPWSLNGGEISTLKWDANWASLNEAQQDTLIKDKVEAITKLARTWGLQLTQEEDIAAIKQIAIKAGRLGLTNQEIQGEFYTNATFLWDPTNTQTGVHARQRDLLRNEAQTYMLNISDENLDLFSRQILTGEMTLGGIQAGFRSQAYNSSPAIADLIDKGFTPQGYFATYENEAAALLERPINFMGDDRDLYEAIAYGVTDASGISRPMTIPEAKTHIRGTNGWQFTKNANDKGRTLIENISSRFGAVA